MQVTSVNAVKTFADPVLSDPPTLSFSPTPVNPSCAGSSTGSITLTASGGTGTVTYSKDNSTTHQNSNHRCRSYAGICHKKVKDANACTNFADVVLTDPPT